MNLVFRVVLTAGVLGLSIVMALDMVTIGSGAMIALIVALCGIAIAVLLLTTHRSSLTPVAMSMAERNQIAATIRALTAPK